MWFQRRADQDETINCPLCRRVPIYACGHEVYDLDVQDLTSEDLEFQCKICSPLSYACGHFVHGDEYPTLRMTTLSMPCWACAPTMKMREHNQSMGIHPLCATISRDPGYYDWASFLWSTAVAFDELGLQADKIGPDRFKRSQMQSIADSLGTQDFKSDHFKSMINTVTLLWKTYTWVQDHDEHRCNELGYTLVAGDKNTLARVQQKWLTDLKKATDAIYYFPVES